MIINHLTRSTNMIDLLCPLSKNRHVMDKLVTTKIARRKQTSVKGKLLRLNKWKCTAKSHRDRNLLFWPTMHRRRRWPRWQREAEHRRSSVRLTWRSSATTSPFPWPSLKGSVRFVSAILPFVSVYLSTGWPSPHCFCKPLHSILISQLSSFRNSRTHLTKVAPDCKITYNSTRSKPLVSETNKLFLLKDKQQTVAGQRTKQSKSNLN